MLKSFEEKTQVKLKVMNILILEMAFGTPGI